MHTTSTCLKRDVKLFSATNTLDTHFSYKTYYNRHNSIFQTNISLIIIDNSSAAYSLMHFFSGHYIHRKEKIISVCVNVVGILTYSSPTHILIHSVTFSNIW